MKNLILILNLITISFLISCKKEELKKEDPNVILVNFINETGEVIENAEADSTVIGTIDANSETGYIRFKNFGIDTQKPDVKFSGIRKGQRIGCTSQFYWCGTEKSELEPGKYNVRITLVESEDTYMIPTYYFDLEFKK